MSRTRSRSLRSRRTYTLALLVTDVTNPFFTTVARGVEDTASAAGYMLILCNTDERPAKEREYLQMLLQKRVDGILLVPAGNSTETLHIVQRHETPLVILDRRVAGEKVDIVRCDSEQGAYELGRLLVSLGHGAIAMLAGPHGVSTSDDRIQGFQRALAEAGIMDRNRVYYGDFSQESGRALPGRHPYRRMAGRSADLQHLGLHERYDHFRPGPNCQCPCRHGQPGQNIRFTVKGDTLYAIILRNRPGAQAAITSLATGQAPAGKVTGVSMLGSPGSLPFTQDADGLHVTLPAAAPCQYAYTLKITGLQMNASPWTASGNPQ